MDEFAIVALVILALMGGILGIIAVAKWRHRALWAVTPVVLWPTTPTYVQAAIVVILGLGTLIGASGRPLESRKPFVLFFAFAAWMVFVFVLHGAPELVDAMAARNHFLVMLLSISVVPITALLRPPLLPTLKVLALSGAAVSVFALVTYTTTGGRILSETHNPNSIGLAAALALLTAVGVAMLTGKARWALVALAPLALFVGSQNRSGLIVIVIGLVLLWILQQSGRMRIVSGIALLLAAPFAVDFALASQRAIFALRVAENFEVGTRVEVLTLAIRLAIENPLFGVGWRHFTDESFRYLGVALNTHNDYLLIAVEGGLVSLALLAAIILRVLTFHDPTKEGRVLRALALAGSLTLLFANITTDFRVTWTVWLLIGLAWSSARNPARKKKQGLRRLSAPPSLKGLRAVEGPLHQRK